MPRANTLASSVEIDVGEEPRELARPEPETPFRILVAGNFSGGAGRNRMAIEIDRDNFDRVLARLAPELHLPFGTAPLPVSFRELDDFHPDRLFARLAPFQALRALRERLSDRATFPAAAAELLPPAATPDPKLAKLSGAELLSRMIGEEPHPPAAPQRTDWDRMLRELVAPYVEAKADPRQPELIAQVDAAIGGIMCAVLHHGEYQALEAAWRGLYFLIRRLETGEDLKVYLLDLPQAELAGAAGLAALHRVAVEEASGTPGGAPWAVMAGLYCFGPEDEPALTQIAAIARSAGAPFLAGLAPDVVGLARVFEPLRRSRRARWIGLALPRFLLRLPYGAKTDAIETFAFEEMPAAPEHERYLWGYPAIACAYLLGEAFAQYGWSFRPGAMRDIEGLPAHIYQHDGASEMKPCAEVLLTEEAAEVLLERGFMPLVSIKGTDCARLVRFQSIAEPNAPLAGRWE
ncbi:MAG: type VI secretion system contractile sheath large subunit [Acidobacteriia bacterium]|nr:type VI secretion system contractile sheath large subunit [Terriglobia bacterium]